MRFFALILVVALSAGFSSTAFAIEETNTKLVDETNTEIVDSGVLCCLSDGSYIEYVTTESVPIFNSATSSLSKNCSHTLYGTTGSGAALWSYTLTATMQYDGLDVWFTNVQDECLIFHNSWSLYTHYRYPKDDTAVGGMTVQRKVLGIVVEEASVSITFLGTKTGVLTIITDPAT